MTRAQRINTLAGLESALGNAKDFYTDGPVRVVSPDSEGFLAVTDVVFDETEGLFVLYVERENLTEPSDEEVE